MKAYYRVNVTKQSRGSAIVHREPPLHGDVVFKLTDTATAGDFKLVVMECTAEQHEGNLGLPGVAGLSEAEAAELAPKYQPRRSRLVFDPRTGKEERVDAPAADLAVLLQPPEAAPPEASGASGSRKKTRREPR